MPEPAYRASLFTAARACDDFRRVLATGGRTQLVTMTIQPGDEIGAEVHTGIDQVLIALDGAGVSVIEGDRAPFVAGDVVVVPEGADHNFINTGTEPLRIITVYGPPEHPAGTVHPTKADADRAEAEHHGRPA
jgi:mannose-6-phosphate isomerase-like protein (cupin superfamily)